jgi:hypothetical protein
VNLVGVVLSYNRHFSTGMRNDSSSKTHLEGKIEGRIEVTGRRGRRRKQVQENLNEKRGYWKLKEEALIALCGELALEEFMDLS